MFLSCPYLAILKSIKVLLTLPVFPSTAWTPWWLFRFWLSSIMIMVIMMIIVMTIWWRRWWLKKVKEDKDLLREICDEPLKNIHAGGQSIIINERLPFFLKKHLGKWSLARYSLTKSSWIVWNVYYTMYKILVMYPTDPRQSKPLVAPPVETPGNKILDQTLSD